MMSGTWCLDPPKDKFVVTSKWLYKIKHGVDGSVEKYKARIIARGFSQKEGVDYDEIFAPVAEYTTIQSIITLATNQGWSLHQMDIGLLSCMARLRRKSTWNNHRGSKYKIEGHMYAG